MSKETAVYTHGHHESVLRSHTWRTAANSAAYLISSLKPHMTILDIGCGPGTITADLAGLVPDGRVTGVDHAPGILDQARVTAAERGLENVEFAVADVHALDYPDDTFDVVHAHQVLQHVGDPVRALREMYRVTKPGGFVAARDGDYSGMVWHPRTPGMDDWLDLYLRVARANGGEPDAGRRLKSWSLQAGCTDITASSSTGVSPPPRSAPGGAACGRTARSPRRTRSEPPRAAMRRRINCERCPRLGGNGGGRRTRGSRACTERFSAESRPEEWVCRAGLESPPEGSA